MSFSNCHHGIKQTSKREIKIMEKPQQEITKDNDNKVYKIPRMPRLSSIVTIPEPRVKPTREPQARERHRIQGLSQNRQHSNSTCNKSQRFRHKTTTPTRPDRKTYQPDPRCRHQAATSVTPSYYPPIPGFHMMPFPYWMNKTHVTSVGTQTNMASSGIEQGKKAVTEATTQTDKSLLAYYPSTTRRRYVRRCHYCGGKHLKKDCQQRKEHQNLHQAFLACLQPQMSEQQDDEPNPSVYNTPDHTTIFETDIELEDALQPFRDEINNDFNKQFNNIEDIDMSFHVTEAELREFETEQNML